MNSVARMVVGAVALAISVPAGAVTVTVPDLNPGHYVLYGGGNQSVVYDGVTFSQSASLGNPLLYNIGADYYDSNPEAVLSSQVETVGVANILISLPVATDTIRLGYSTFNGSDVTFLLSNGASFVESSVSGGYYTITNTFSVSSSPFNSVLVTSPDYVMNIDNISYGAVPEPATWAMMLAGLVALRFRRSVGLRLSRESRRSVVAHPGNSTQRNTNLDQEGFGKASAWRSCPPHRASDDAGLSTGYAARGKSVQFAGVASMLAFQSARL